MKELSIEEKAKRYDLAIEVAEKYHNGTLKDVMETIFPELKESEDERIIYWIRKELEDKYVTDNIVNNVMADKVFAWLEKQEQHKKFREGIQVGDKVTRNEDGMLVNLSQLNRVAKKDEQKPADKVEPKFRIGDWVIDKQGITHQIANVVENVTNHTYGYDTVDGEYFNDYVEGIRLWTIQDAKAGDVLHSIGFHNDCIFIFNGLDNWKFDEPNGDRAVATGYCSLSVSADKMEFGMQGPDCIEVNTIKPATEKQRDLLFQKMNEVGYEWDSEKLELKKIRVQPQPKQEWSEEDNEQCNRAIYMMEQLEMTESWDDIYNWPKSIKERVQLQNK